MHPILATIGLLTASNVFMTFAWWYLKEPPKLDYLWAAL